MKRPIVLKGKDVPLSVLDEHDYETLRKMGLLDNENKLSPRGVKVAETMIENKILEQEERLRDGDTSLPTSLEDVRKQRAQDKENK